MTKDDLQSKTEYFFKKLEELSDKQDITLTDKLSEVLEELNIILPSDASQILLLNENKKLVNLNSRNLDKEIRDRQYEVGEGVVGKAVEEREIYFTGDIKSNVWNKPVKPIYGNVGSFKNMYSFVVGGFRKGAIVLASKQKNWFRCEDLSDLKHILPFLSVFIKDSLKDRNHALDIVMGVYRELEAKHEEYRGHAERVQGYTLELYDLLKDDKSIEIIENYGEKGFENFRERLSKAAFLHDIGKIRFRDKLLDSSDKFTLQTNPFKDHCVFGYNILRDHGVIDPIFLDIALHHHQNYDCEGGYPAIDKGNKIEPLKGREIPWVARIVRPADCYDALRSKRPYREALSKEEALQIMDIEKKKFDPYIFNTFFKYIVDKGK